MIADGLAMLSQLVTPVAAIAMPAFRLARCSG